MRSLREAVSEEREKKRVLCLLWLVCEVRGFKREYCLCTMLRILMFKPDSRSSAHPSVTIAKGVRKY
jgi:hypothetical protein